MKKTVVVGMSGGVDSSVTALLMKQQGYNVIGMFMKNWEEKDENGVCKASLEYEDVVRVCEHLEIPYYSVNFVKEYRDQVFSHFINELKAGHTPNPDILCNREIKFKALLEKAIELGADYLATGHYAQIGVVNDETALLKGLDPSKDQSYFLYTLKSKILENVLFPVGHMLKKDLRQLAREHNIPTSDKQDSTGICFIGERNFKSFISQYLAFSPGKFETVEGKTVGKHDGVAFYTIGQRKGLGIGGEGDAWFVVGKDIDRNVVKLAQGSEHSALYADNLVATDLSWVSEQGAPTLPFKCKAKIRYRQSDQSCTINKIENGEIFVEFDEPQRAITPRQSIVFYSNDLCLGGAMIKNAGPSYFEMKKPLILKNIE